MTDPHPGDPAAPALFTDLYQLTMAQAYVAEGMAAREATFSTFFRALPPQRNYLLACGLDTVLSHLESMRFDAAAIAYLTSLDCFTPAFLDWLRDFRFTGDVCAVAEGTPVFPHEPVLEITAPIAEAQLVETFVLNQIHLQTLLASKAARVVAAARGRPVVDFGARRIHGVDAAVKAARAFAIAGVAATSNVLAGQTWGLPVIGTMAHSYVQASASEIDAFRTFARRYPGTTLLVDTYDTQDGVRNVIRLARELGTAFTVQAIRLDSGDIASLAVAARRLLDDAGLQRVQIFASGGLDEFSVARIVDAGAPVDAFGVGTRMGVSDDAPALEIVYKLTAFAGSGRLKLSPGKAVLPGRKQVWRGDGDIADGDLLGRYDESQPGRPLLHTVMIGGRRTAPSGVVALDTARAHAAAEIARLPEAIRNLAPAPTPYPVRISPALRAFEREVEQSVLARHAV
ncbi:MAG: nicotinate phosphoribosyltransferase [Proteobacteria bacterium]|nr:nicotinate phosphoribosyltransferase [Pseudomonadota bacterium]MDA1131803.1 nicotinate phosphoribosyltransferase [Pseudomonadota bacterium]